MWTLYRILIRLAVAWLGIVGVGILIVCIVQHSSAGDWGAGAGIVLVPPFLVGVLAWIVKPVQWTQD